MTTIRLFILTLMLIAFLISCNSDDENEIINNPPTNNVDTLGNLYGHIQSTEGHIKDAYVTLANSSTFSDSNGNFIFYDCAKKSSILSIYHSEFEAYSNTIMITDSLNLVIPLSRLKYDYFPLKVGNHWQYHHIYSSWSAGGGGSNPSKIDWEVVEKSGNYPKWIFKLKETIYDSTYNSIAVEYFYINCDNNDTISINGTSILMLSANKFQRYYSTTYTNSVYSQSPPNSIYQRNIGLIEYNYGWSGGQMGAQWWCKLINYSLQ
ncbi:MAG: hypothetical protein K8H86_05485 [Ignavibacteriaceae bacterium]|nr:hypothetical protein [Ignavibacteriaceae bacterium]